MKTVIAAAAILATTSTVAMAEGLAFERPTFAGMTEYNFETQAWAGEVGTEIALGALSVTSMALGSYANEEFAFDGTEVTAAVDVVEGKTTAYLTVGTTDEFEYKDATAGVRWSF